MDYYKTKAALSALWPGVFPDNVCMVLRDAAEADPSIDEAVEHALSLPGPEAATHLMVPVASTFESREAQYQGRSLDAVAALIRAGGDPSDVLQTLADGLGRARTTQAASGALAHAVLFGWSVESIRERLMNEGDETSSRHWVDLSHVRRLASLQHQGQLTAIKQLAQVYRAMAPWGNLKGAVGLLEAKLLEPDNLEARRILEELSQTASYSFATWMCLLPMMHHYLSSPEPPVALEACKALDQVKYLIRKDRASPREAARVFLSTVGPTLEALAGLLSSDAKWVAHEAAKALLTLVEYGGALGGIEATVESGIDHPSRRVRASCSTALSTWLIRSGAEKPTPDNTTRRRLWSDTDEPKEDEPPMPCNACSAPAPVLYTESEINQFDETHWAEAFCKGCGLYSQDCWGYV